MTMSSIHSDATSFPYSYYPSTIPPPQVKETLHLLHPLEISFQCIFPFCHTRRSQINRAPQCNDFTTWIQKRDDKYMERNQKGLLAVRSEGSKKVEEYVVDNKSPDVASRRAKEQREFRKSLPNRIISLLPNTYIMTTCRV